MMSRRSPVFPKIVILTSSSRLAASFLKFVAFDASTVKSFCAPSPFEKVSPLSCRTTPSGAGGGAFAFSRCATHLRSRYTPAVSAANKQATAADQRAYLAASLLVMLSVKQNLGRLYTKAAGHDSLQRDSFLLVASLSWERAALYFEPCLRVARKF